MASPTRPSASLPATNLPSTLVVGNNLEGHHVGDAPFYYNGTLGILQSGPSAGELTFVPVQSGPPVPESEIPVPPDINTAWRSMLWALGSGLPDGLAAARTSARQIRRAR